MNFTFYSQKPLSQLCIQKGIEDWKTLVDFIQLLPYGRNSNREELSLVLTENKGTCSSKHAFLKKVAQENNQANILLILGMYTMDASNTPGIGNALEHTILENIPEAHCYLYIDGIRTDVTSPTSNFNKIKKDLLEEIEIGPEQISEFKIKYHQKFIKAWLQEKDISLTFKEVWNIREQCIKNLSL